jgi:hypothetical protein
MTSITDDVGAIAVRLREIEQKHEAKPACSACEGGGWECYGLGFGDPHFRICPVCGNPDDLPCP